MPISQAKKELLHLTVWMSVARILGKAVAIPASILVAKWLGPALLGAYSLIELIGKYASYANLGIVFCLNRELPMAYGKADLLEAKHVQNTIFTIHFFASGVAVLGIWALYFCGLTFGGVLDAVIVLLVSLIFVFDAINTFLDKFAKAQKRFMLIARIDMFTGIAKSCLSIPAVLLFGLKGLLLAVLLTSMTATVCYVYALAWPRFGFYLNLRMAGELIGSGLLMFLNKMADSIFWSVDLLVLGALAGNAEVGIFRMAITPFIMGSAFSQPLNMTINRAMMFDTGKAGGRAHEVLNKYAGTPYIFYIMFCNLVTGVGVLLFAFLVRIFLVEYQSSLEAVLILFLGYVIYSASHLPGFNLNAAGRLITRLTIVVGALVVNGVLAGILVYLGFGVRGAAWACMLGFGFISAGIIFASFRPSHGQAAALIFIAKIIASAVITALPVWLFFYWNFFNYGPPGSAIKGLAWGTLDLLVKIVVYIGIWLAAYCLLFRKFHPWRELLLICAHFLGVLREQFQKLTVKTAADGGPGDL